MAEYRKIATKAPETKQANVLSRTRKPKPSQFMDSPVGRILHLQKTVGNRTVQRMMKSGMLQAKLGQPNDIYEQEADRVADQVMRMPEAYIQQQPEEKEEEDLIQSKPFALLITPLIQRQSVQRQVEEEEEETLQTKNIPGHSPQIRPNITAHVNALRGGGQPLPQAVRAFFEPRFEIDFRGVRVHTSSPAAKTAQALNARAFTAGRDVVFGASQYSPGTTEGRKLLAHELTHVVQQKDTKLSGIQRACNPTPLKRADFLKKTGSKPPDAPFGLTTLIMKDVKFPGMFLEEVSTKRSGRRKRGWTLSKTAASLPQKIPSFYTAPGKFEEKTKAKLIVPEGICSGPYRKMTYIVSGDMANLFKAGEQEHCDDFQYAFNISLSKFARAVNKLAGKRICRSKKAKCRSHFKKKLKKMTGTDPDKWNSKFICLAEKSKVRDNKKNLWHLPGTRTRVRERPTCHIRALVVKGTMQVGKHPSAEIIKCP